MGVAELPLPCVPSVLPRDFACNAAYLVSSAATTLVTLHFQPILNIQLAWLSCWMPPMRAHNLHALASLIITSGAAVNSSFQVGKLIQTYGNWISDNDEGVQGGSRAAIRALGAVLIDHSPALRILLDFGTPPLAAVRNDSLVNVILEHLRRVSARRIASSATTMVTLFCHLAEVSAEQRASCPMPSNADAADICLCYAVRNLLRLRLELDELSLAKLMRSLLLLPSFTNAFLPTYTQASPSSNYMVNQSLVILLAHFGQSSRADFVQISFDAVIGLLPKPNPCYEIHTVSWLLLSALVRICPGAVASVFDTVLAPILLVHVHPCSNPNPEARIKALSLLHTLMCALDAQGKFSEFTIATLIESAVLPNLVWYTGRTANSTRKAALAVLHGVLHSALTPSTGLSMEQTGIQPILRLLPVLGTSLDEYDTSSREISLSCLTTLLNCLPPTSLQLNSVLELYPAIVKRLDDSLDDIRLEACATFSAFARVTPPNALTETILEYCIEHFLVHLDDANVNVQSAVFQALLTIGSVGPLAKVMLSRKVSEISFSHRDPALAIRLLNVLNLS